MLVLVGPSASGKSAIVKYLTKNYGLVKFITCTTRAIRVGEVNDVDYHFLSQEEFLEGFSNPRNPELMRVFRDLNFVEQLGKGIQRVLKTYDRKIFEFFPNHIRVTVPFFKNEFKDNKNKNKIES